LDEDSPNSDIHLHSTFTSLVHKQGEIEEVQKWADETVDDTHLGKRKTRFGPSERKGKMVKFTNQIEGEDEDSDDSTNDHSPGHYGEDDNHSDGGDNVGSYVAWGVG
jgi:hypothetical protein